MRNKTTAISSRYTERSKATAISRRHNRAVES